MNIDLWESAGELWARWGRGCIMVQQNWRFVGETPAADSPAALFYADVSEKFPLDAESFEKFLRCSELDALGLGFGAGGMLEKMAAVETSANQYQGIRKAMIKKFLRAVTCCLAVAPAPGISISPAFIAPNLSAYAVAEVQEAAHEVEKLCGESEVLKRLRIKVHIADLFLAENGVRHLVKLLCEKAPEGAVGSNYYLFSQALNLCRCILPPEPAKTQTKGADVPRPNAVALPSPETKSANKSIRNKVKKTLQKLFDDGTLSSSTCSLLCQQEYCMKRFGLSQALLQKSVDGKVTSQGYHPACKVDCSGKSYALLLIIPRAASEAVLRWAAEEQRQVSHDATRLLHDFLSQALHNEADRAFLLSSLCNGSYCKKQLELSMPLLWRKKNTPQPEGTYSQEFTISGKKSEFLLLLNPPEGTLSRLKKTFREWTASKHPHVEEQPAPAVGTTLKKADVLGALRPLLQQSDPARVHSLLDAAFCSGTFRTPHSVLRLRDTMERHLSCLYYKDDIELKDSVVRLYARLTPQSRDLLVSWLQG